MKKFKLEFSMENAVFEDAATHEICRILDKVKNQLKRNYPDDKIRDINGNTIGEWRIEK